MSVPADPESTRFCLCLHEAPMLPAKGFSVTVSPFRRPTIETMPTNAKAGCLYPNNGRAILEARSRGFDNCLVRDMLGNVAETGASNIFMVKDSQVFTPAPNRTFLSGITRARTIDLLAQYGFSTVETTLTVEDFMDADEIFHDRQPFQGRADHTHRGPRTAARPRRRQGARTLLGMGARLIPRNHSPRSSFNRQVLA